MVRNSPAADIASIRSCVPSDIVENVLYDREPGFISRIFSGGQNHVPSKSQSFEIIVHDLFSPPRQNDSAAFDLPDHIRDFVRCNLRIVLTVIDFDIRSCLFVRGKLGIFRGEALVHIKTLAFHTAFPSDFFRYMDIERYEPEPV